MTSKYFPTLNAYCSRRRRGMLAGVLLALATALMAAASAQAQVAAPTTVCTGDVCVVTGGYAGLQVDISGSGAPASAIRLLASEVALSQAFHPPGPCVVACVPSFGYRVSEGLLVLVDYQVGLASGLIPRASCPGGCGLPGCPGGCAFPGCPGGCTFPPDAARAIDGDIRAIFADPTMSPPGQPTLPTFISGTTT
jgi:hypothetical protein